MEPSAPAESSRATTARHTARWAVVLLAVAVLGAAMLWILRDGPQRATLGTEPTPSSDSSPAGDRSAAARDLISRLESVWREGDVEAARDLASPGSRPHLADLTRNVRELGLRDLSLRYITDAPAVGEEETGGRVEFDVDVQVTWRLAGVEAGSSTLELPMTFTWDGSEARFVTVETGSGDRVPLWLQERARIRRTPKTVLVTTRRDDAALAGQVREAWRTVRRTLPEWRRTLVVEAPRSSDEFEAAAGMDAASASAIAAITTTADGSSRTDSAVQVYLNPPVFDPLGPQGRQIVLSHEATHVAMDALSDAAPHWLSEGFADYVALADTDLQTSVLAAQILALVREDGPPRRLPGRVEFDGANEDIGAWYEAAWLAAKLVADRYGEDALLELHERSVQVPEGAAFRQVLGVSKAEFTDSWAEHLVELAR